MEPSDKSRLRKDGGQGVGGVKDSKTTGERTEGRPEDSITGGGGKDSKTTGERNEGRPEDSRTGGGGKDSITTGERDDGRPDDARRTGDGDNGKRTENTDEARRLGDHDGVKRTGNRDDGRKTGDKIIGKTVNRDDGRRGGDRDDGRRGGDKDDGRRGGDKDDGRRGGDRDDGRRGGDRDDGRRGGDRDYGRRGGDRDDGRRTGDRDDGRRGGDRRGVLPKQGGRFTGKGAGDGPSEGYKSGRDRYLNDGRDDRRTSTRAPDRADRHDPKKASKPDRMDNKKHNLKDTRTSNKYEQERKLRKEEEERKKKEEEKKKKDAEQKRAEEVKKKEEEQRKKEEEERLLEEKKKLEEEDRLKKEEEDRIKAEEEAQKIIEEEKKVLNDFLEEAREKQTFKTTLRAQNIAAVDNRPDDAFFSKLDSSLKKNTAFVKKLRNLTESQKQSLIKDFEGLNLSKYTGEAASGIAEAKLKMSDIHCAVQLSSLIHQRYSDFQQLLLDNFQKILLTKKDDRISNPSKYRVDLRFFADLVSVGVFTLKEGLPILANQLSLLINSDKDDHNHLSIISSFLKHCGDDYVGFFPRKIRLLSVKYNVTDTVKSILLPPERKRACRNLLKEYHGSLSKHLLKAHKDLKNMEKQNRRILQTKGELSTERKENYESALTSYQKLQANALTFADLLDEDLPDLPDDDTKTEEGDGMFDIYNPMKDGEFLYEGDKTLFEDEDSRSFYETIPDLRAFIPGILYKDSEHLGVKEEAKDDNLESGLEEDIESLEVEELEHDLEMEEEEKAEKESVKEGMKSADEPVMPPDVEEEDGETGSLMKSQFEAFALSLPNCVNRDLIDKAAIEFCMNFNTKSNRKKLVRALFTVHRTRYDLLPFYARLVAILYPCMPDVANDLLQYLKGDFRWHMRKKDQINIESKLKTVRFIGELVKFKMCPKSEALHCIKMLMFDFSHHNIEMACALLEACGRFLYRSPDSHHRTKVYLEVMMRKKVALHLGTRYTTMIENAYFYSNPPDVQEIKRKVRPPIHEYIRKLLYKDLSKVTTEKVLRQMRKLDWDNVDIAFYITKCLTAVWNIRYNSVHCAANLLAGLAPYHEHVAIQVVDGVLEDIRLGMEVNHPKYNQRRVSCIKYLGELYNYRMVESSVIFKSLYSYITFGVSTDDVAYLLDPPEHLFRIRLVCVLLETCGQYFDKGSSRKKLDCFLAYFQRYYWIKKIDPIWNEFRPFPRDVDNLMHDTLETVRPKLHICQSYEEAVQAAEDIEKEYKSKIASLLPVFVSGDESSDVDEDGLGTIQEGEEDMDELSESLSQVNLGEGSEPSLEENSGRSRSRTGSQNVEGDDQDDDVDDLLESAGEDEMDDQVTLLTGGPKRAQCQEDDDFMAAFDKMMSENIQARTQESLKVPPLDIAVPMHLKGKNKKAGTVLTAHEVHSAINFTLMTRRGNKQQFTNLNVPISAEFAAKFKEREQAERLEKEKMKQVVLGIQQRQEEEDYQEMLAQLNRPMPLNTNRERKVRYHHPKGAPDADLIFGSK
ncbi:regulator of nonsense transcripts 2-like isoform X2 [Gigantopelta aegis]|nr:regulator of nonsense transcripts 2-like isoform X2 [Gigantopelta aegis]